MNALLLLVATSAAGVSFGWQPLNNGGVEYIIQIEPQALDALSQGHAFSSELPAGLDVRRFRIVVGTDPLPREAPALPPAAPAASPPPMDRTSGPPTGSPPPNQPTLAVQPPPPASTFGPSGPTSGPASAPASFGDGPLTPIPAAALAAMTPPGGNGPPVAPPAQMGSPQPVVGLPSPPPLGAVPPAYPTPPAWANPAATAADGGPELKSPAAIANAVSGALDDPAAPGRGAPGETAQPRLPAGDRVAGPYAPRTLDPDPRSGQLAEYTARPHEAQRPSESKNGPELSGSPHPAGEHAVAPHAGGQAPAHEHAREAAAEPAEKPWGPLMGTVLLLLFSISANVYLGWIAWESRMRYRDLLADHTGLPMTA